MGSLFGPHCRNNQPQLSAQIDWSNPITRGLVFAVIPGIRVNIVTGAGLIDDSASVTFSARRSARAVEFGKIRYLEPSNSTDNGAQFDLNVLTAFTYALQDSAENSNFCFYRSNGSSAPGWGVGLHGGSFNGPYGQIGTKLFSPLTSGTTTTAPRAVAVTGDGTNAICYIDGRFYDSGTYSPATYQYSSGRSVQFGTLNGTNASQKIRPFVGLLWNRPLSPAEIKYISDNPWKLFKTSPRLSFDPLAGGGLQSLTVTPSGGWLFAGTSPVIRGAIKTPTGGYTFGGTSPSLRGVIRAVSGGFTFGGTTTQLRGIIRAVSGGYVFGGASTVVLSPDPNAGTTKHNIKRHNRRSRTRINF